MSQMRPKTRRNLSSFHDNSPRRKQADRLSVKTCRIRGGVKSCCICVPPMTEHPVVEHLLCVAENQRAMASLADSELSPALLKVATHVYRFPLPATKVIAFTKCFADNLGAEETSKSIRSAHVG